MEDVREDVILSSVAVLVQVGAFDETAECMVMFQLCDLLTHKSRLRPYILMAYEQLSRYLGYCNQVRIIIREQNRREGTKESTRKRFLV